MRVFVTGGTGFVGANVVRSLLERGYSVRCLIRESSPRLCVEGLDVEFVEASLSDVDALAHAMDGCGAVQHVAGTYDSSPKGKERMHFIHVDATRNLMDAALKVGAERFIVCSSSVTVGWGSYEKPGDEQTPSRIWTTFMASGPHCAPTMTPRSRRRTWPAPTQPRAWARWL